MDTSTQSAKAPEASNNACSVSSQPTEMRGARTNFVIPKNKLSGALVPVTRASKWEPIEPKIEHLPRSVSRKTKWAPDLSEDPDVKRRRALALQVSFTMILLSFIT
jgi:splicing factor 1